MVVRDGETEWLIEAKTVGPNAEIAVREAIGQLYTYRYFYYGAIDHPDPKLLALFSAPIGAAFERLLEELAIEYVCRVGGAWVGSMNALDLLNPNVLPERV